MANHMILDTETTGTDKPFCYDIGYTIINDNGENLIAKHYVVEQVWHNLALFESAYYAEKRPLYIQMMRQRTAVMDKYGYIMRNIATDIKKYNVVDVYAYNADFDDNVFTFNCDWFKCNNPLENIPVYDIWGYASQFITNNPSYWVFCEENKLFTKSGNYSGSAESVYRYITDNNAFEEAHIGVFDADIEKDILIYAIANGAEFGKHYKVNRILTRAIPQDYTIKVNNKVIYKGQYIKVYHRNNVWNFTEAGE